jgi:hypothetical protein
MGCALIVEPGISNLDIRSAASTKLEPLNGVFNNEEEEPSLGYSFIRLLPLKIRFG